MEQTPATSIAPAPRAASWRKAYYVLLVIILCSLFQPHGGTWAWLHDIRWLYVFFISFLFANLLTPAAIRLAWYFKILDYPDPRKMHSSPIPRVGGIAIFAAVLLSTARNYQFSPALTGLIAGGCIIYVTGLIDDIHPLSAGVRLLAQLVAAMVVVSQGVVLTIVPLSFPGHQVISAGITVLWLIGLTKALNFMDGIDGLATGMTALCSLFFFLIAWPTRQSYLAYVTIALCGAALGFLPYNWKRARIFLGDAGSTFMGFMLAGLAVMGAWAHNNATVALSTPLLILGIPIFDMIYTTISRVKNGSVRSFRQWLEYTGKDHFHHRLMHLGLSEPQTVFFILMVNLCLGLGAIVIRDTGTKGSMLLLIQSVIIFLIIVVLMLLGRQVTQDRAPGLPVERTRKP
jgi:UDP-GlcNAc:undecaprenyl-phosphate GlcNAc-1-phosphate transferase